MDNWTETTFDQAVLLNPATKLNKGTEYPFVDMKAIEPAWRNTTESEYRTFKSGGSRFMPYDTLMARITPCLENGKIARYIPSSNEDRPAFGSTEFIVIRGKGGVTDNNFAYYLTRWQEFRNFAISQMTGSSGRQRVPVDSLSKFKLKIPTSITEQKAIAHILGSLDDKIELNRRMNETLEATAQALFKSWFVDFDPVIDNAFEAGNPIPDELAEKAQIRQSLGDARKPLPKDIKKLFPDEFEDSPLGPIPNGWVATNLEKGIEFYDSQRIPLNKRQRAERQGKYPYYGAAGIMDYIDNFLFDGIYILVGEDGTVQTDSGEPVVQYVWGRFWVNNHAHILRGKNGISNEHLFLLLKDVNITPYITGAVQPKVSQQNLKKVPLLLPPEKINKIFEVEIENLFFKTRNNAENIKTLSSLRDTLLPKLLSGEIRVPDAEKLLEDNL